MTTRHRAARSHRIGRTVVPRRMTDLSAALAPAIRASAGDGAASAGPPPAPTGVVSTVPTVNEDD